jgi:hypothetical protein
MPTLDEPAIQTREPDEPAAREPVAGPSLPAPADLLRRWYAAGTARLRALGPFPGLMLLAVIAFAAFIPDPLPTAGLDNSWQAGLNLAREHGLRFGTDVLFTYGPWGFLDSPRAVSRVNLLAGTAFSICAVACGWLAFYGALRRRTSDRVAAVAAAWLVALAAASTTPSSILLIAATLAAIEYVGSGTAQRHGWVPAAVAGCAAFLIQVKFSEGLVLALVAAACVLFAPRRPVRRAAEVAAGFVVVTVLAWLLAGQHLGDLPRWLRGSWQVAEGYTDAMSQEIKPNVGGYLLMIAVILVVLGYLVRMVRAHRPKPTAGVLVIAALILYLGFREGFNRHDGSHQRYFFAFALPVLAWFLAQAGSRALRAGVLVAAVLLSAASWLPPEPRVALGKWSTQLQLLVDDGFRNDKLAAAKAVARGRYALSPQLQAAATGHPVTVDPTEINLAWAYDLDWRPAVIFQSYSAYSAPLDQRNADFLAGAGPDHEILRAAGTIDGRNWLWDPPRYVLTELCDYRAVMNDPKWLVLRRSVHRCSAPRELSRQPVAAGQAVPAPAVGADQVLMMSFRPDRPSLAVRAGRLLDKSFHPLMVSTGDHRYRLPRRLADGPLLAAVPLASGWPRQFGGGTAYRSVAFSEPGTLTFSVLDLTSA